MAENKTLHYRMYYTGRAGAIKVRKFNLKSILWDQAGFRWFNRLLNRKSENCDFWSEQTK
jgi:hypothetical protein